MAAGLLYMPSSFNYQKGVEALTYPFSISNGIIVSFKPDEKNREDIIVRYTKSLELDASSLYGLNIPKADFYRKMDSVMSGKLRSVPVDSVNYQLSYWDNNWISAGESRKMAGKDLVFSNVPKNAVFRLLAINLKGNERIFSYKNQVQEWW